MRSIVSAAAIRGLAIVAAHASNKAADRLLPDFLLHIATNPLSTSRWLFLMQSYATAVPMVAMLRLIVMGTQLFVGGYQ
jgi:hypothetical protein